MSDLERFTRRGFDAILQRHGIDDSALLQELTEHAWSVRAWQPSGPAEPIDPRIAMIERVWGCRVPSEIRDGLIADLGDATEEQLRAARVDWIKKNPRNRDAFTAVSWAKHSGKDNRNADKRQEQGGGRGRGACAGSVSPARQGRTDGGSVYSRLISDASAD